VSREKLRKKLSFEKAARKMLVKLTPGNNHKFKLSVNKYPFQVEAPIQLISV